MKKGDSLRTHSKQLYCACSAKPEIFESVTKGVVYMQRS